MNALSIGFWGLALLWGANVLVPRATALWRVLAGFAVLFLLWGAGAGLSTQQTLVLWGMTSPTLYDASAQWLLGFGLMPVLALLWLPYAGRQPALWLGGVLLTLLGVLIVLGTTTGGWLLWGWALMGFGGAIALQADGAVDAAVGAQANLWMLALLEVGAVALLLVVAVLGGDGSLLVAKGLPGLTTGEVLALAVAFIVGFGAKLGLLPFYDWYADAYSSGTGATGALLSGVVLSAAWLLLGRALLDWLPVVPGMATLALVLLAVAIPSAVLAILLAFQQEDWRRLLAYSSVENAALATAMIAIALLFRTENQPALASLAWLAGLIHMGGHSIGKGVLLLLADQVRQASGSYRIRAIGLLNLAPLGFGLAGVFGAMSLSALPPQAGFASEWLMLQTIFHSFDVPTSNSRILLALAGAGFALTAAIGLASMVKLVGIGLIGRGQTLPLVAPSSRSRWILGLLALMLPLYAFVLPWTLPLLASAAWSESANRLVHGVLIVPLSDGFAFISPTMLLGVMPLLALIPLVLVGRSLRRARRVPTWAGGLAQPVPHAPITAFAFSNALRSFYSMFYRPRTEHLPQSVDERGYFVRSLRFTARDGRVFRLGLFLPLIRAVRWLAHGISPLQSGSLNRYLGYLLIILLVLLSTVFWH